MPDLIPASPVALIDFAITAWLHAKRGRSGSAKTATAYADTLTSFRTACQRAGLDLDGEGRALTLLAQAWAGTGEVAAATYNQRLAIVSSFYAYAHKQGLIEMPNPIVRVARRPVQEYAHARALDYSAIREHLGQIDRTTLVGQRDYALVVLALITGRRLSELVGLAWQDVAVRDDQVTLTWRHCKGGRMMYDSLPAAVGRALLGWLHGYYGPDLAALASDTPLWVSLAHNGTGGRPLSIRAVASITEARLGTSKVHVLRHTFAKAMEDTGAKVSDIQARLGHSNLATTSRYLQALRAAENPQAEALATLFGLEETQ